MPEPVALPDQRPPDGEPGQRRGRQLDASEPPTHEPRARPSAGLAPESARPSRRRTRTPAAAARPRGPLEVGDRFAEESGGGDEDGAASSASVSPPPPPPPPREQRRISSPRRRRGRGGRGGVLGGRGSGCGDARGVRVCGADAGVGPRGRSRRRREESCRVCSNGRGDRSCSCPAAPSHLELDLSVGARVPQLQRVDPPPPLLPFPRGRRRARRCRRACEVDGGAAAVRVDVAVVALVVAGVALAPPQKEGTSNLENASRPR